MAVIGFDCGDYQTFSGKVENEALKCLAALAQLGERQTEDLKVPGSIPGGGIFADRVLWCNWLALRTLNPAIRVQIPVGPIEKAPWPSG